MEQGRMQNQDESGLFLLPRVNAPSILARLVDVIVQGWSMEVLLAHWLQNVVRHGSKIKAVNPYGMMVELQRKREAIVKHRAGLY